MSSDKLSQRWIEYFKRQAYNASLMSKDENTKVGSCIFCEENKVEVSSGWNDLPRNVQHKEGRNSRPSKYKWTTHSEANSIANAARLGRSTSGKSIVVTLFPCSGCSGLIINSGISKVYTPAPDFSHIQYGEDFKISVEMLKEAGVAVVILPQ